jgi:diaminopimelate decarboxylase
MNTDTPSHVSRLLPDTATFSPEGFLHIANYSIPDLVKQYGTPLYIFDRTTIVNACTSYMRAFREFYHTSAFEIVYASKAYLSPLIAQLMAQQGMGLDVVSGGELIVAKQVDFPMARNYNLVPRPAVILVDKGTVQVMERRETYADIVSRYQEFERDQGYMLLS